MKVLIVDDEPFNVDLLEQELADAGVETLAARDGQAALSKAANDGPDLILLDIMMPGMDGFEVCESLKATEATQAIPVIFMTALAEPGEKLRGFQAGAVDYITKPFQTEELLARVRVHLELRRIRRELEARNERLREEMAAHRRARATIDHLVDEIESEHNFGEIIGESPALQALFGELEQVAATDSTVLIQGETGTGKELVARALHARSPRTARPLIRVNCAALPRELVESELFGHEKGAFTGATQLRRGRFELADNGTVFLDEAGELPLEAQAKLLRVLQEQEFERVGGSATLSCNVRIIAATNRRLDEAVAAGAFRSDLFYRLNVFPVTVPPLRKRREDIPVLARHFMARAARQLGKPLEDLSPAFLEQAAAYDWPGNVRELENLVMRAAILSRGPLLEPTEPPAAPADRDAEASANPAAAPQTLAAVERGHILAMLERTGWVIEGDHGAAAILGLNPSTLRGRMRKLGLRKPG